jgi:hypothetical protein
VARIVSDMVVSCVDMGRAESGSVERGLLRVNRNAGRIVPQSPWGQYVGICQLYL